MADSLFFSQTKCRGRQRCGYKTSTDSTGKASLRTDQLQGMCLFEVRSFFCELHV